MPQQKTVRRFEFTCNAQSYHSVGIGYFTKDQKTIIRADNPHLKWFETGPFSKTEISSITEDVVATDHTPPNTEESGGGGNPGGSNDGGGTTDILLTEIPEIPKDKLALLAEKDITTANQVIINKDKLTEIKGIGEATASNILEAVLAAIAKKLSS